MLQIFLLLTVYIMLIPGIWALQMLLLPTVLKVNEKKQVYATGKLKFYMFFPCVGIVAAYKVAALEGKE